jgi:hypothetical protein
MPLTKENQMALSKKDKKAVSLALNGFICYYTQYLELLAKGYKDPERADWRAKFGEDKTDWVYNQALQFKKELAEHGIETNYMQAY